MASPRVPNYEFLGRAPADRLYSVGHALYGRAWQTEMALTLEVPRGKLVGWSTGAIPCPSNLDELLAYALDHRSQNLARIADGMAGLAALLEVAPELAPELAALAKTAIQPPPLTREERIAALMPIEL